MELLYLYIEKYRNFEKQEFCFTSEYEFVFKRAGNIISSFEIKRNSKFIPGFVENKNIQCVTAVIGQNGTGKSNLMQFILSRFPYGAKSFREKMLYAYKSEGKLLVFDNIFENGPQAHFYEDDLTSKRKLIKASNEDSKSYSIPQFADVDFVFYSNNFDLKIPSSLIQGGLNESNENLNVQGFFNISTQSLITYDELDRGKTALEFNVSTLDIHKLYELSRNIEFILSERVNPTVDFQVLEFNLPSSLSIQIEETHEYPARQQKDALKGTEYEKIIDFFEDNPDFFSTKHNTSSEVFLNHLIKSVIFSILWQESKWLEEVNIRLENGIIQRYYPSDLLDSFREFTEDLESISSNDDRPIIENIWNLINFIQKQIAEKTLVPSNDGKTLSTPITHGTQSVIDNLFRLFRNTSIKSDLFLFSWRSLSSGEQSLLTLFSRFHYLKKKAPDLKENLMILVDEGDLYFHPEWQRKYLKIFLDNIPSILGKDRKYQFIFTANTPFLAADLPTDNIIFLEKREERDENGERVYRTEVVKKPNLKTFAANIHELLANGFYLSSFLGEFAQQKIEGIVTRLTDEESIAPINDKEQEQIRKTILAVGEPIIKARLEQLYEERFETPLEDRLEQEIAETRARLEKLEALKKKKDDQN